MANLASVSHRRRKVCVVSFALVACMGGTWRAKAQVPGLEFEITPRVLVSAFGFGDRELGTRIAGLTTTELARRFAHRDLWVITIDEMNAGSLSPVTKENPPRDAWDLGDLNELAKQLHAALVEVNAAMRSDGRVNLEPQIIRRGQTPVALPAFNATDVADASRRLADLIARVPDLQRIHPPAGVCSAKVFRDYQVDRPTRFIEDPRAAVRPDGLQHYTTDVDFVVDPTGRVMPESFRLTNSQVDSVLARDARRTFTTWRFVPAEVGACKVRQLVQTGISR